MASPPTILVVDDADFDYPTKINGNFASILNSSTGIVNELNALNQGQAIQVGADLYRRISSSDEPGGVVGPYSFHAEWASGSDDNMIYLRSENADQISACVIAGQRRQHAGSLSFDLDTLGLGDATHTIYVGLDPLDPGLDVTMTASTTETDPALVLYEVRAILSVGTWTVTKIKRTARTMIIDGTWVRLENERPRCHCFTWSNVGGGSPDDAHVIVPYDHTVEAIILLGSDTPGTSGGSLIYNLKKGHNGTTIIATATWDEGVDGIGVASRTAVGSIISGTVYPANQVWHFDKFSGGGDVDTGYIAVEVLPAYHVQTF